jgi:hypothetical protein
LRTLSPAALLYLRVLFFLRAVVFFRVAFFAVVFLAVVFFRIVFFRIVFLRVVFLRVAAIESSFPGEAVYGAFPIFDPNLAP